MKKSSSAYRVWLVLLLACSFLVTACGGAAPSPVIPTPEGTFAVDPLFHEFYDLMGGEANLGRAISPIFPNNHSQYQILENAMMGYDPSRTPSERYHFVPVALEWGITEPPVPAPDPSETTLEYKDGHYIYSGFLLLYRQLGGPRYVGSPLTEVHYNQSKQRFEQFFENFGFAWLENTPPDQVFLLAYGARKCDSACRVPPKDSAEIDTPIIVPASDEVIKSAVQRLGADFVGYALTGPYTGNDGKIEQVYLHMVLVQDMNNPMGVTVRPLLARIGILPDPMIQDPQISGTMFYAIEGDLGYNIPIEFSDYIALHGGWEISGKPITNLYQYTQQNWRQCFENYCLDYHLGDGLTDAMRVEPSPLGYTYRDMYYREDPVGFEETQSLDAITLQVWERYPLISSGLSQEIGVHIFEGTTPLENIEPILVVDLPDGTQKSYYFPPTGVDGKTSMQIDPVNAPNGTPVSYQVCISSVLDEVFCIKDAFVIWYAP